VSKKTQEAECRVVLRVGPKIDGGLGETHSVARIDAAAEEAKLIQPGIVLVTLLASRRELLALASLVQADRRRTKFYFLSKRPGVTPDGYHGRYVVPAESDKVRKVIRKLQGEG
jgi:hypothetical protein